MAESDGEKRNEKNDQRNVKFGCFGGNRFIILIISTLFLSFNLSSILCYNATYISIVHLESSPYYSDFVMSNQSINNIDWNDRNLPLTDRRFVFEIIEKSLGFAVGYIGAVLFVIPMGRLMKVLGCHKLMSICGLISTILVSSTPIILSSSFPLFILLRFLQGIACANLFTTAGIIVNEWAANNEKGLFISVLSAHVEVSVIFTMPISGAFASLAGWPSVFYLHGIILGILTLIWIFYYRNQPELHPFTDELEAKIIGFNKAAKRCDTSATPIRKIISSLVIWSIWIAVIGNYFVSQFSISFAPLYLRGVIKSEPSEAGILTLIPMACLLIIKFSTGFFSDRIKSINELNKIKMFNSCALLGSSIFFIILSCSNPGSNKVVDVILLSIPMALLGFSSGGYGKCAVLVSGQYSPFVMSIIQTAACLSIVGGSFVVPALTPNDTFDEWRRVFMIYGIVLSFTNTIFIVFASDKPEKWAQQEGDILMIKQVIGDDKIPIFNSNKNRYSLPTIMENGRKIESRRSSAPHTQKHTRAKY